MGNFKFTPESVLEFSCPGIGTSTNQATAVTYFKQYLTSIGKSVDSNGYLDTDTFMVRSCTKSDYQTGTLDKQYSDKYMNGSTVMYKGCLYQNNYWPSFTGYVVLPFKVNGSNIKLVLPGTLINTYHNLGLRTSGTGTITRKSSGITITGTSTTSIPSSQFENDIVPFYCIAVALGGGGGGSSSEALKAGRGGGGGACGMGILNFLTNSGVYNFSVGAGGAGGYHTEGTDSSTSSHHDGASGKSTYITANGGAVTLIQAGGGFGGTAQSTSCASGGSVQTNNCPYKLYPINKSTVLANREGGRGSVDTATEGSSVSISQVGPMSSSLSGTVKLANGYILENATYYPGTSYNPGGAGGGATCFLNGANGGSAASVGSNGSDGYGNGGGGGGYLIGSYIDGGKGGSGRVQFWC